MRRKLKNVKLISLMLIVFFLSSFYFFLISPVYANESEYLGTFKMEMYLNGYSYEGNFERIRTETNDNLTTYFGTYFNVTKITRSYLTLSNPNSGYLEIYDDISSYDETHNLRQSNSTWKLRMTGYQKVTIRSSYEYGNYNVLQDTETTYEETYTRRYYENGVFDKSTSCRDLLTLEDSENITVTAGTFNCTTYKLRSYEGGSYEGYSMIWLDDEGFLIKQSQYDDSNNLYVVISLVSKTRASLESPLIPGFNIFLVLFTIILIGTAAMLSKFQKHRKII